MIIAPPILIPSQRTSSPGSQQPSDPLHPFKILPVSNSNKSSTSNANPGKVTVAAGYVFGMKDNRVQVVEVTINSDPLPDPRNNVITDLPSIDSEEGKLYVHITIDANGMILTSVVDFFSDEEATGDEANYFYLIGEIDEDGNVTKQFIKENIFFTLPSVSSHPFRLFFGLGPVGHANEGEKGVFIQSGVVRDMLANQLIPKIDGIEMLAGSQNNFLFIGEFVGNVYLKVTVDESDWSVEASEAEMVFYQSSATQPVDSATEKFAFIGFYNLNGNVSNSVQWSLQINRCGPIGTAISWLPY